MIHQSITDDMPADLRIRPRDHRGFPVPWFVTLKDERGRWDFGNLDAARFKEARQKDVCWATGAPLGRFRSFVVGPMCVINRVAGDPPVKRDVARYSVKVCPFLANPRMRRVGDHGEVMEGQRGVALARNPGVTAIYTVDRHSQHYDRRSGLFHLDEPDNVEWFKEGRPATRAEARAAMDEGFPTLLDAAESDGPKAIDLLVRMYERAVTLLPA